MPQSAGSEHGRHRARSRTRRLSLGALGLALLGACARTETEAYLDLTRELAFARVETAELTSGQLGQPAADPDAGRLFVPAGARVSYAFTGRSTSTLEMERLAVRGDAIDLEVLIESDHAEPRRFVVPSGRNRAVDLGLSRGSPTRLTVSASGASFQGGDGVLLTRPQIRGPSLETAPELLSDGSFPNRPNVIIYLVDTLRRDRLGVYRYRRPVSPHLDEFARTATVFENSYGQSSWTKPSLASIFTGVWPPRHGATGWRHLLSEEFETLAERLRSADYSTAAFVTNINASESFGLAQGFDHLWFRRKVPAAGVNGLVFDWLDRVDRSRPFFLYVHTMEPHAAYRPEEPYRSRFAPTADQMPSWKPRWRWPVENLPFFSDLYDGEVAQNDAAFGALMARLGELELFEEALIVFLSDHGEEFREHGGWRHGRVLHGESLDVPLVIKFPRQHDAKRSKMPVAHVDILPTVLEVAGLPAPDDGDGASLVRPRDRPVFSHLRLGKAPLQYSVIADSWKLIRRHRAEIDHLLFNLVEDPGEENDLAAELPIRTAVMASLLDRKLAASGEMTSSERALDEALERELRALGYLR